MGETRRRRDSSVAPGEKVQNSVDIGGVADMAEFQLKVEILFEAFYLQAQRRAVGQVINYCADSG
jgi:hypothetical protein